MSGAISPEENQYVRQFRFERPKYEEFCIEMHRLIKQSFDVGRHRYHTIEYRAKSLESFADKSEKTDLNGEKKYSDPIRQITDLAGVRIITYTIGDVDNICKFINSNFDVLEMVDVGEERFRNGKFGYQSIHFLVKLNEARRILPENSIFCELICEIQVRTVLQHAWAEIEHDIQYKNQSDLPRSIQRKFISLAGLLEIADREFQFLQETDHSLKDVVKESLQDDITLEMLRGKFNLENKVGHTHDNSVVSVRNLVKIGKYEQAIDRYTEKIESNPGMYTLYLGRAKAYFLSGNAKDALLDIDSALDLKPDDDVGRTLRFQILEGAADIEELRRNISSAEQKDLSNEFNKKANEHLVGGDGVSAFEYYSKAQEMGASRPFSLLNKAMCCFVSQDYDGAKSFLSFLDLISGTQMAINIRAMYCLIFSAQSDERFGREFDELKRALADIGDFDFNKSPLKKLRVGLNSAEISFEGQVLSEIDDVFSVLKASNSDLL